MHCIYTVYYYYPSKNICDAVKETTTLLRSVYLNLAIFRFRQKLLQSHTYIIIIGHLPLLLSTKQKEQQY